MCVCEEPMKHIYSTAKKQTHKNLSTLWKLKDTLQTCTIINVCIYLISDQYIWSTFAVWRSTEALLCYYLKVQRILHKWNLFPFCVHSSRTCFSRPFWWDSRDNAAIKVNPCSIVITSHSNESHLNNKWPIITVKWSTQSVVGITVGGSH